MRHVSVKEAHVLVREAIERRCSTDGGLRGAFQFFDRDRSGRISHAEFCAALKE